MSQNKTQKEAPSQTPPSRIRNVFCPTDKHILAVLKPKVLNRRGVKIHSYKNGADVLKLAESFKPALCITPWSLDDMDAKALAEKLNEIHGEAFVPLVVIPSKQESKSKYGLDPRLFAGALTLPFDNKQTSILLGKLLGIHLRKAERFPIRVRVFAEEYMGTTLDLSTQGMLVGTDKAINPDTEVEVQFALPGSTRRMSVMGKVIRSDMEIIHPRVAVAFSFSSLSGTDRKRLENYISSLVGGRTFSWDTGSKDKETVIHISGRLSNTEDLLELSSEICGPVKLNLSQLKKIEPTCKEAWVGWLRGLSQIKFPVPIVSVSYTLGQQIENDPSLFAGTQIQGITAVHVCEKCDIERNFNVALASGKEHTGEGLNEGKSTDAVCPQCGGEMTLDEPLPDLSSLTTSS